MRGLVRSSASYVVRSWRHVTCHIAAAQAYYMQLHIIASFDIRLVNPTGVDRPRKRQEEPSTTLTGDRPNTKSKRPGEEMTRTNPVVMALATELAATRAGAARLPFQILAPRNQDAADGQRYTENKTSRETVPAS